MEQILSRPEVALGIAGVIVAVLLLLRTAINALAGQTAAIIELLGGCAREWLQARIDELRDRRRAHVADLAVAATEQTANGDTGQTKLARARQVARDLGICDITNDELEAALKRAEGWYRDVRLPELRMEGTE